MPVSFLKINWFSVRVILCRKEPRFIFAACRTCPYDYGSSVCLEQVQYDCLGGLYYWNPYEDKCKMNGMNIFILDHFINL